MRKVLFLASALSLLLPAGSVFAQTVKVNWQMQAPFADYRTYAWKDSKNQGSQFYRQWVEKDVDAELAKKGLQKVAIDQNPRDLYLLSHRHAGSNRFNDHARRLRLGRKWMGLLGRMGRPGETIGGPDIAHIEAQPRFIGILAVDIVDAKKKELVWRGQATTDAISNSQKGDEKQVLKSVDKMFKQFPPCGKTAEWTGKGVSATV